MNYWDKVHKDRFTKEGISYKRGKFKQIASFVNDTRWAIKMPKLEIGCGSGIYAFLLNECFPGWTDDYIGIETSVTAVQLAKEHFPNLNIMLGDGCDFKPNKKFDLFVLWDVLEHIEYHEKLAKNIKCIGTDKFSVMGNIPLYTSIHEGYERPMDIEELKKFAQQCGLTKLKSRIFGFANYPYMLFHLVK